LLELAEERGDTASLPVHDKLSVVVLLERGAIPCRRAEERSAVVLAVLEPVLMIYFCPLDIYYS